MKTSEYRSKMRIMFDILDTIDNEGEAKITTILYRANLSYDRLKRYLNELMDAGLVKEETDKKGRKWFYLTSNGRKMLNELRKVISLADAFGLRV